jgi:hypothetical protein
MVSPSLGEFDVVNTLYLSADYTFVRDGYPCSATGGQNTVHFITETPGK